MIKVMMKTPEGQETDLLPDSWPLERVFEHFHQEFDGYLNMVDGKSLKEEDRTRQIQEFSRDAQVRFMSFPIWQSGTEEHPDSVPVGSDERADITLALLKLKETINQALDDAMDELRITVVSVTDENDPPF